MYALRFERRDGVRAPRALRQSGEVWVGLPNITIEVAEYEVDEVSESQWSRTWNTAISRVEGHMADRVVNGWPFQVKIKSHSGCEPNIGPTIARVNLDYVKRRFCQKEVEINVKRAWDPCKSMGDEVAIIKEIANLEESPVE